MRFLQKVAETATEERLRVGRAAARIIQERMYLHRILKDEQRWGGENKKFIKTLGITHINNIYICLVLHDAFGQIDTF